MTFFWKIIFKTNFSSSFACQGLHHQCCSTLEEAHGPKVARGTPGADAIKKITPSLGIPYLGV